MPDAAAPTTATIWLFADTQLNATAGAETHTKTGLVDQSATSAIRPPSVDLWSEVLLTRLAQQFEAKPQPILFMGDAANTSCTGEFGRFLTRMRDLPWFGVLGNHDGFYMGNMAIPPDAKIKAARRTWQGACDHEPAIDLGVKAKIVALEHDLLRQKNAHAEQGTLAKSVAVWMYLEDLHRRVHLDADPMDGANWHERELPSPPYETFGVHYRVFEAKGEYKIDGLPFAVAVEAGVAFVDPKTTPRDVPAVSWQGYVVQDIELPGEVHAILLDTSDFLSRPEVSLRDRSCGLPGVCGRIEVQQKAAIERFIAEHGAQRFFLVGHHNFQTISVQGAANLAKATDDPRFIGYISGHEHRPTARASWDAERDWELNLASVTDWPMQFAELRYPVRPRPGDTQLAAKVNSLVDDLGNCVLAGDEIPERDYGSTQRYVLRALRDYSKLYAHLLAPERATWLPACGSTCVEKHKQDVDRFIAKNETRLAKRDWLPAGRKLLADLIEFDRSSLRASMDVVEMERRCAAWGSKVERDKSVKKQHPIEEGTELAPNGETRWVEFVVGADRR